MKKKMFFFSEQLNGSKHFLKLLTILKEKKSWVYERGAYIVGGLKPLSGTDTNPAIRGLGDITQGSPHLQTQLQAVPVYLLCTLLLFYFHLLPSPVHPTRFSFCFFLVIFILMSSQQQLSSI